MQPLARRILSATPASNATPWIRAPHHEARLIVASRRARLSIGDEHIHCIPDRGDQDETDLRRIHQVFM
jgi:hypothetical protein